MTATHDTFALERTYPVPVEKVWAAWADLDTKLKWFGNPDSQEASGHTLDFRVGGKESFADKGPNDAVFTYDATFYDIVEHQRIVSAYDMTMDARRISVSVQTVLFEAVAGGTRLTLTEQGAFLDGLDKNAYREAGTAQILDKLGTIL